jgi:hypothetical protein
LIAVLKNNGEIKNVKILQPVEKTTDSLEDTFGTKQVSGLFSGLASVQPNGWR